MKQLSDMIGHRVNCHLPVDRTHGLSSESIWGVLEAVDGPMLYMNGQWHRVNRFERIEDRGVPSPPEPPAPFDLELLAQFAVGAVYATIRRAEWEAHRAFAHGCEATAIKLGCYKEFNHARGAAR